MQRRDFLAAPAFLQTRRPNDLMRVAIIGPGGRGTQLLKEAIEFSGKFNARVTGVCDIWKQRRDAAAKLVRESYSAEPVLYPHLDDILADKNVDAVIIATPDFQHARMLRAAVEAGKDVYCEKPMGNVLSELNAAYAAIERTGRIVQLGTQRRSYPKYRAAARLIREGRIGSIVKADVIWNMYSPYRWAVTDQSIRDFKPEDTEWKEFLYGRPDRPFDPKIYRSFRLFKEFSTGIVDQWMTHGIDVVHMLTGAKYPQSVAAQGGLYCWKDYRENPDTIESVLKYDGFMATYATSLCTGEGRATRFMGTKGSIECEEQYRVVSQDGKTSEEISDEPGTVHHMANWLDCVRRRDARSLYCPAEAGYGHSIACIMTVESMESGRRINFNPATRQISS